MELLEVLGHHALYANNCRVSGNIERRTKYTLVDNLAVDIHEGVAGACEAGVHCINAGGLLYELGAGNRGSDSFLGDFNIAGNLLLGDILDRIVFDSFYDVATDNRNAVAYKSTIGVGSTRSILIFSDFLAVAKPGSVSITEFNIGIRCIKSTSKSTGNYYFVGPSDGDLDALGQVFVCSQSVFWICRRISLVRNGVAFPGEVVKVENGLFARIGELHLAALFDN